HTSSITTAPLFIYCSATHRPLHSFPTRRSSDLHDTAGQHHLSLSHHSKTFGSFARDELVHRGECALAQRNLAMIGARYNHVGCADRKSTRLNSSHDQISYAVFCLKKKKKINYVD